MKREQWLVALVIADFMLAMSVIGIEAGLWWTLPEAVRPYVWTGWVAPQSAFELVLSCTWLLSVVGTFVAWVGLLQHWRPARALYLVSWALNLAVTLPAGVSVMSSAGAVAQTLDSAIGGMLLGLLYFTDLRERFEARPVVAEPRPLGTSAV